jgi:SAM-dependent methyltransferase
MSLGDTPAFVQRALPPAPARVLEVGAGDGELATLLAQAGYDVLAIDPAPAEGGAVRPVALADLDEPPASFDAAVAVLSLHHVNPLAESCAHLAGLLAPGAVLVLDEFDVGRVDVDAASWWLARGGHDRVAGEVVAELRHHCHTFAEVVAALAPWFEPEGQPARGPYLYRWALPDGMRDEEEAAIAAGEIQATGVRLVARRAAILAA